jgi:hypothetical protein
MMLHLNFKKTITRYFRSILNSPKMGYLLSISVQITSLCWKLILYYLLRRYEIKKYVKISIKFLIYNSFIDYEQNSNTSNDLTESDTAIIMNYILSYYTLAMREYDSSSIIED